MRAARQHARIRHLLSTDPGGAWVAEHDGRVAGVALALIREGVWGFSLFAVAEALQGRGVGRALFARCWPTATAPRAAHRSSARPTRRRWASTRAAGLPSARAWRRPAIPDLDRARRTSTASSTPARPASRWPTPSAASCAAPATGATCRVPMAHGARLLVFEDRAFAVARDEQPDPARRPRRARPPSAMLWAAVRQRRPGATVNVDFLTAGQDWALPVCLDARLSLSPDGPMFAGGDARAAGALHPERGVPLGLASSRRSARRRRGPAG